MAPPTKLVQVSALEVSRLLTKIEEASERVLGAPTKLVEVPRPNEGRLLPKIEEAVKGSQRTNAAGNVTR